MLKAMPTKLSREADEMRRMAASLEYEKDVLTQVLCVLLDMKEPMRTLCDEVRRKIKTLEAEQTKLIRYAHTLTQIAEEYRDTEFLNTIRVRFVHPADLRPFPVLFSESDFSDLHLNE